MNPQTSIGKAQLNKRQKTIRTTNTYLAKIPLRSQARVRRGTSNDGGGGGGGASENFGSPQGQIERTKELRII
jgi:hypothetical protein